VLLAVGRITATLQEGESVAKGTSGKRSVLPAWHRL
jgi:hypothetical protein